MGHSQMKSRKIQFIVAGSKLRAKEIGRSSDAQQLYEIGKPSKHSRFNSGTKHSSTLFCPDFVNSSRQRFHVSILRG